MYYGDDTRNVRGTEVKFRVEKKEIPSTELERLIGGKRGNILLRLIATERPNVIPNTLSLLNVVTCVTDHIVSPGYSP